MELLDYEVVVTRNVSALPPPFVCVVCRREINADPWAQLDREPYRHKPPICFACSGYHTGNRARIHNITRGDHHALNRLSAITDALTWEAFNHGKWWNQPAQ